MPDEVVTRWLTREDIATKTISYAQNYEDVLLYRAFGAGFRGRYIDVGANDPIFHSVTKLLYERGWRGINIEPTPVLHRRLVADRPEDNNLNVGISDAEGTLTFFEVAPPLHGWSTFMPEIAAAYRNEGVESTPKPIKVTTLNDVFERYVHWPVDVLKIDAEGFERQVIGSLDWRKWRPRVVMIEATWTNLWEPMLLGADYTLATFDGLNRYYVRTEEPSLLPAFAAPVNVLDNCISYEFVRLLASQPDFADLNPAVLSITRRLKQAARRAPRLARVVKQMIRKVG